MKKSEKIKELETEIDQLVDLRKTQEKDGVEYFATSHRLIVLRAILHGINLEFDDDGLDYSDGWSSGYRAGQIHSPR